MDALPFAVRAAVMTDHKNDSNEGTMNDTTEAQRALWKRQLAAIGPCYQTINGVYCGKYRSPDSAAGLCGRCYERQELLDKLKALSNE